MVGAQLGALDCDLPQFFGMRPCLVLALRVVRGTAASRPLFGVKRPQREHHGTRTIDLKAKPYAAVETPSS